MSHEDDLQDPLWHDESPEPEPFCIWCGDRLDDEMAYPYCSLTCSLEAERDSGEDEEVTA